jgi:hypothetical protein
MSFYAIGTKKEFSAVGVSPANDETSLELDVHDPASVDKQIAQFLRGTRRLSLDEHREKVKIKNLVGLPKKRLSEGDWEGIAERVGATSLLSLLYRKRIQANYRDIDSLAFSGAEELLDAFLGRCDLKRLAQRAPYIEDLVA